jgi:cytochrome b561
VPAAEGGGLFGYIEGLLLVSLVAAGLSGVTWFLLQGSDAALTWRMLHIVLARILVAAGVLHVLAVASHLLDLVRD